MTGDKPKTRSRTGCLTCRKHKKKCDELAYPTCNRCQSKGLECVWPQKKQEIYETLKHVKYINDHAPNDSSAPVVVSLPPTTLTPPTKSRRGAKTTVTKPPPDPVDIHRRIAMQQDCVGDATSAPSEPRFK